MSMLVDTGAWYAIADASDRLHERASRFYAEHAGETAFVTTDLILAETMALVTAHLGRSAALTYTLPRVPVRPEPPKGFPALPKLTRSQAVASGFVAY